MVTTTIDTRGLQFLISGLQNALIGTGSDCENIVRDESRRLALECANVVGPRNRAQKTKSIPGEIGRVFTPAPARMWSKEKQGDGGMVWLNSGPNFLTGIRRDRFNPNISSIKDMYRAFLKVPKSGMGKKYQQLGTHYGQTVSEINRIMVKRGVFKEFVAFVISHIGRMKASFVATAKKIDPATKAPAWIERHVQSNPKAITDLNGLKDIQHPSVTFGSSAVGIEKFKEYIARAVRRRQNAVAARLKLVLFGYSRDVARGIKIKRHAKEQNANS